MMNNKPLINTYMDTTKTGYLSDVTRMQYIYNTLANGWYDVTGIIDVKDHELGIIGDLCIEDATEQDVAKFINFIEQGEIVIYKTIDSCPINPKNAVDVILLPPFYLVKDRKVIFQ